MIPELERELLHYADRAEALQVHGWAEEKVRSLEVLAHARCRSKEHILPRVLFDLSRHRKDMLCGNAVAKWRLMAAVLRCSMVVVFIKLSNPQIKIPIR